MPIAGAVGLPRLSLPTPSLRRIARLMIPPYRSPCRADSRRTLITTLFATVAVPVLILLATAQAVCVAQANDAPQADSGNVAPLPEPVQQLDEELEQLRTRQRHTDNIVRETRRSLSEVDLASKQITAEFEKLRSQQAELSKQLREQQQAADKLTEKRKSLEEELRKTRELEQKAIQTVVTQTRKVNETKESIVAIEEKHRHVEADSLRIRQELLQQQQQLARLGERETQIRSEIEAALKQHGRWVSFTDQISPIFYRRCVACHNQRSPQGQYNMTSYSAIRSPGESGSTILPGDPEESLLCLLVEDGSMPKDAEPLSPEEIETIRQWVASGARLDVGVNPEEELIRIMPRPRQPAPPSEYRLPIPITAVALHPEGTILATSGYHEILLWSFPSGELIRRIDNVAERVHQLQFPPDGSSLAVASGTPGQLGEIKLFDPQTGELSGDLYIAGDEMFSVAFSPDGSRLAAGGSEGKLLIFDLQKRSSPAAVLPIHSDWIQSVVWTSDNRLLATASRDKTAKVVDAHQQKLIFTFKEHSQNVRSAGYVTGQQAFLSTDATLRLWKPDGDGKSLKTWKSSQPIERIVVIGDQQVALATMDGRLVVRSLLDENDRREIQLPHQPTALALAPDRTQLIVGDVSGQVSVVSIAEGTVLHRWLAIPSQP